VNVHHAHERRRRARSAQVFIALLLGLLTAAFFRIQVLGSDIWELRSTSNRIRLLPLPAPRGIIYDRNGNILADNVPGYAITLLPSPLAEARETLERMSAYVDIPEEKIERLLSTLRRYGREVVIDADADFEVVSALEERRAEFRGLYIEMRPRRRYLLAEAAGHVLGYVGEITADELDSDAYAADRYREGMIVGQGGLEEQYESRLQGRQGLRYLEFDARQRIVGDFGGARTDPGQSGQDLHLNLDMELQAWIHSIFPDSMAGAVVALDPSDGGVLALYSAPSFDPNDFVGGISTDLWASLNEDDGIPLYNRAVLGKYPPASIWKLATAAIGLDLGVVTPDEYMAVPCTGSFTFGTRSYRCHLAEGHGFNNLTEAIGNSCDVYFYQLGLRITLDHLLRRATEIGFSQQCGIDLPQESQGTFPPDRAFWEQDPFNYAPREGEVISLSIGQGPNAQTPLKMAQLYVALARDGTAPTPALAQGVDLGEGWSLELAPQHLEALLDGLRAVTAPGGTAHFGTSLEYWEVLGKTGTAEHALSQAGRAPSHAWFAGMAGPFGGPPEVVVVVIVEYGRVGSGVAAPIMAKTADFYLRKKYGIPIDSIQAYREHIMRGPVPAWYRDRYPTAGGTR